MVRPVLDVVIAFVVGSVIGISLSVPLGIVALLVKEWLVGKITFHYHPKKGPLCLRHHRTVECDAVEKWGGEALRIWEDLIRAYPQISGKEVTLSFESYREDREGGIGCCYPGLRTPVAIIDLGRQHSEDCTRGTISHELWHAARIARFGFLWYLRSLFTRSKSDYYIEHYLRDPEEMSALVFSANYSREEAAYLRIIRRATTRNARGVS